MHHVWVTGEREERREERVLALLRSPGIILGWVWDGPGTFSKEPIGFPSFCRPWIGLHPLVRQIGLYGPAPLPAPPTIRRWIAGGGVPIPVVQHHAVISDM